MREIHIERIVIGMFALIQIAVALVVLGVIIMAPYGWLLPVFMACAYGVGWIFTRHE